MNVIAPILQGTATVCVRDVPRRLPKNKKYIIAHQMLVVATSFIATIPGRRLRYCRQRACLGKPVNTHPTELNKFGAACYGPHTRPAKRGGDPVPQSASVRDVGARTERMAVRSVHPTHQHHDHFGNHIAQCHTLDRMKKLRRPLESDQLPEPHFF